MIHSFNSTHKFTRVFEPVSQEDIVNCPEFFAMSTEEIAKSGRCPRFLSRILELLPLDGDRPNVIQVKPQNFRLGKPAVLGDGIHLDVSVMLKDGRRRAADNLDDFKLMTVSFGDVVETQFAVETFESEDPPAGPGYLEFFQKLPHFTYRSPAPNQLAEYTSRDLHRLGGPWRLGRARLLIVAFSCNKDLGGGLILPSLFDRPSHFRYEAFLQ